MTNEKVSIDEMIMLLTEHKQLPEEVAQAYYRLKERMVDNPELYLIKRLDALKQGISTRYFRYIGREWVKG